MSDRYPWRDTSSDISAGTPPQWETPGGAQEKVDTGIEDFAQLPEIGVVDDSITARKLRKAAVITDKIAPRAVTLEKMAPAPLDSANHTYSGVVDAATVKEAIDKSSARVEYFIEHSGDSVVELVDARIPEAGTPFPKLGDRLNNTDAQVAETVSQITALDASKAGKGEVNELATQKANQVALDAEITNRANAVTIEKAERMAEIDVERNRISNLATLTPGSTTGDAELKDTRVGYDGSAYTNAGSSVRLQTGKIAKEVSSQGNDLSEINGKVYATWQLGGVSSGTPTTGVLTDSRIHSTIIPMSVSKDINVSVASGAKYIVHLYGASGYLGSMANYSTTTTTRVASITHPTTIYAIIVMGYIDDRSMTPSDVEALAAMLTVVRSDMSRIDSIESKFGGYLLQEITMTDGFNINLGAGVGNAVTLTPETVPTYRYAIVNCMQGDLFTINGIGGANPRLWGFVDANNILLSVANSASSVSDSLVLTAPKNAVKLIINDSKSGRKSYTGADLTKATRVDRNRVSVVEDKAVQTDGYLYGKAITMINGYNITLAVGVGNAVNMTPGVVSIYRYAVVDCSENDMFVINGTGGENPRLWGFVDSNNILLSVADAVKTEQNLLLVAPKNASKLIINDIKTGKISYSGANLSKTLGGVVNKMNDSDFETRLEKVESEVDKANVDRIETIGEDYLLSILNGITFSEQLQNLKVTDFEKPGDLMVHVSTFAIINDVVYMTYYANTRSAGEIPTEHTARFAYCPLSDVDNKTFIDLQDVGDTFNGMTVTEIYDTILMRKDDSTLYLMWTVKLGNTYFRVYRIFDITTNTLGDIQINYFKVGDVTNEFSIPGMESAFAGNDLTHKPMTIDIGIMQKLSSRDENGTTYYYTGCYANEFNCIIKSSDLITWEYVAMPDFENESQFENSVYVLNDRVFYFLRQKWECNVGILTYYDLNSGKWNKPVYVNDCQSRSDFFYHDGGLYLIHAPKDRNHLEIMKINSSYISQSQPVQTAKVPDYFYPYVLGYGNLLYISFTVSRKHIRLCYFTELGTYKADTMLPKLKTLFLM